MVQFSPDLWVFFWHYELLAVIWPIVFSILLFNLASSSFKDQRLFIISASFWLTLGPVVASLSKSWAISFSKLSSDAEVFEVGASPSLPPVVWVTKFSESEISSSEKRLPSSSVVSAIRRCLGGFPALPSTRARRLRTSHIFVQGCHHGHAWEPLSSRHWNSRLAHYPQQVTLLLSPPKGRPFREVHSGPYLTLVSRLTKYYSIHLKSLWLCRFDLHKGSCTIDLSGSRAFSYDFVATNDQWCNRMMQLGSLFALSQRSVLPQWVSINIIQHK